MSTWRQQLRSLKLQFDAARKDLGTAPDRNHPAYLAAREAYRHWQNAIDAAALTLLDELDQLHEENALLRQELAERGSSPGMVAAPVGKEAAAAQAFSEMEEMRNMLDSFDISPHEP